MRAYVKPELFYENFELAQNIAACHYSYKVGNSITYANMNSCYVIDADWGIALFADGNNNCEQAPEDYCYQPGEAGLTTWKS